MLHSMEEVNECKELVAFKAQSLNQSGNPVPNPFGPIRHEEEEIALCAKIDETKHLKKLV